jgi:Zn-dependent membrane protease YugP
LINLKGGNKQVLYAVLFAGLLLLIYGPQLWVRYVIRKHDKPLENMPGTGAELARHLIERFALEGVTVEETEKNLDYFSPSEKVVGLAPEVYNGKSLSAVAIATHEVGHAIQHCRAEPVSKLRNRYLGTASRVQHAGILVLSCVPLLGVSLKVPAIMLIAVIAGVAAMLASVVCHALVLPEEYDASFGKAMPILQEGYVPDEYLPAIQQVLKACALTYVAGALADILSIWRWLAILR